MSNDYYGTILIAIKEIYEAAKQELKEKVPNPNESDLEYKHLYSIIKTRASKFVDSNDGKVKSTYLIPFFDFLNHKQRKIDNEEQEREETRVASFTIYYNNYDGKNNVFVSPQPNELIKLANGEQVFLYYGEELKHHGINELLEEDKELQVQQQAQVEIPPKK